MKQNKRYLVIKKGETTVREWKCLEVSDTAYKINPIITEGETKWLLTSNSKEEFWILKTYISTTGEAQYKIIEELSSITDKG